MHAVADTYISSRTSPNEADTNYGTDTFMRIRNDSTASRKAYLRFDLTTLGANRSALTSARLTFTVAQGDTGYVSPTTVRVWGLNDSHPGESWNETAITHNSGAPANTTTNALVSTDVTLLGSFNLPGTTLTSGQAIEVSHNQLTELIPWIQADTNNSITLILTYATTSGKSLDLATREHPTHGPARLILSTVPEQGGGNGGGSGPSPPATEEFDEIRERWRSLLAGGAGYDPSDPDIAARIEAITSAAQARQATMIRPWLTDPLWQVKATSAPTGGLWSDLTSTTNSRHIRFHYERVLEMALAWSTQGSPLFGNPTLQDDVLHALEWLYAKRYNEVITAYDNWFDWEVAAARELLDVVVLMWQPLLQAGDTNQDGIPDRAAKYMLPIQRFSPNPRFSLWTGATMTAANRFHKVRVALVKAAILRDSDQLTDAILTLSDKTATSQNPGPHTVFRFTPSGDGYHRDGTFIQHNFFPYNTGYGRNILLLINLLQTTAGTRWDITDPDKANVFDWLETHYLRVLWRGGAHPMFAGRDISEEEGQEFSRGLWLLNAINRAIRAAPPERADFFRSAMKRLILDNTYRPYLRHAPLADIVAAKEYMADPSIPPAPEIIECRIFPMGDRVIHRRPGWMFSISMYSNRIRNFEFVLGQNARGWHTASGMTYLHNADLGHYSDHYWPTVNAYRMPGTTVDTRTYGSGEGWMTASPHAMVGGVSVGGLFGAAAMQYRQQGSSLTARKSWFLLDDEVVALGTGITCTDNRPVETIVENRKLTSDGTNLLHINGQPRPTTLGLIEQFASVTHAHLAGGADEAQIGYLFPGGTSLVTRRESRTGSWRQLNSAESTETHTNRFLSMHIPHGSLPSDASYAYAILPGASPAETANRATTPGFTILDQSQDVHAVRDESSGVTAAVFWTDTPRSTSDQSISASLRCVVAIKQDLHQLRVAIADPAQPTSRTVRVTLNRPVLNVVEVSPAITVVQTQPILVLDVAVGGTKGASLEAVFATAADGAGTPFGQWIRQQLGPHAPPEDLLPDADPDGDGIENLMEFAIGGTPTGPDPRLLPHVLLHPTDGVIFRHRRRSGGTGGLAEGYRVDGLLYTLEVSPTLQPTDWFTGPEWIEQIGPPQADGTDHEWVLWRITPPPGWSLSRWFSRLRIQLLEE
ncbi:MAG: polysaccharide lyase family 8 super-sandwich domain-containing protein [Verrucomicrobiia bacterium]